MTELLLLMLVLFIAYLFLPSSWLSKFSVKAHSDTSHVSHNEHIIPEDSVLRRHFITQLRSEIELELSPRPTDFTLQRHHDTLVASKLENRLSTLAA